MLTRIPLDKEHFPYSFGELLIISRTGKNPHPERGELDDKFRNMQCGESITQTVLGDLIGKGKNWVSKIETGEALVDDYDVINLIADVLECSEEKTDQLLSAAQCDALRKRGHKYMFVNLPDHE